jgi:transposase InsO family protein
MSKRRAVITAVTIEGLSQTDVARRYGVTQGWVSKLLTRYRDEGDSAFEPRSRRPHSNPNQVSDVVNHLIVNLRDQLSGQGLDAGPETIAWHLEHHHQTTVSVSTVRRRLITAGRITPEPRKRPRSSYIRFEADLPNETWQTDVTHYWLGPPRNNQSNRAEILTWLDDHSRYALSVTAHAVVTGETVVDTFTQAAETHRFPASALSDNAFYYTTRFAGGKGGRNAFETLLAARKIKQKNSQPNHPTTCGKVERFQQTMKNWLRAQPSQPATLDELQALLDSFVDIYNHHRPHRSIGRRTPSVAYNALPKTGPTNNTATNPHYRTRHDHIDTTGKVSLRRAGRMHHIGIGRAHTGTPVTLIIEDLDIRVIATQTGELLRHLTLDPNRDYQPQKTRKPRTA